MPRLLERLYNSKRMLVVVVYLSMFLDNILLTVVVPIIPDYLYTSEQKEYVPTLPLYSESNDSKFSDKKLELINSSTLQQCLENYVPSDISPSVKPARQSSLHKIEERGTTRNKEVVWNVELKDHGHQLQLGRQLQNVKKDKEHAVIQNNNHQSIDGYNYPYGNQYTLYRKKRMSRSYKRDIKDKYATLIQYSSSDKRALSNPEIEKVCALLLYQKRKSALISALIRGHNSPLTEDRRKRQQTEETKIKYQEKPDYMQNYIAGTLSHTRPKTMKSLMVPEILHTQQMSVFHNRTSEEQNNTGQHVVPHNQNAPACSDCGPSHKEQAALTNCNASGRREQDAARSGASGIFTPHGVIDENGRVGVLLSSKALVQLVMNPIVGAVTSHVGYHLPLFVGSINLLVAALLFAFGEHFMTLLLARSLQGIASACISVSGMSLVAEQFPDDVVRSKVMGIVLGSMAVGVLVGYPFGSLLYDFVGKMAPFIFIAVAALLNGVLQIFLLDLKQVPDRLLVSTSWQQLLSDGHIVLIAGAIWLSTSTMAILEPCLPIWLMDNIKPRKWQLGMVFIPDSVGYLLGTNLFGPIAYNMGRWRVAVSAMMLVGLSTVLVPSASNVGQLAIPHFGLGLGIGVVDAALVPLLASLMDSRFAAHYGSVYALQQMAVSLAYSLGPLVGGEMVRTIGFPWLMRSVGLLNCCTVHCLFLPAITLEFPSQHCSIMADAPAVNYKTSTASDQTAGNSITLYRRFLNSEDSD